MRNLLASCSTKHTRHVAVCGAGDASTWAQPGVREGAARRVCAGPASASPLLWAERCALRTAAAAPRPPALCKQTSAVHSERRCSCAWHMMPSHAPYLFRGLATRSMRACHSSLEPQCGLRRTRTLSTPPCLRPRFAASPSPAASAWRCRFDEPCRRSHGCASASPCTACACPRTTSRSFSSSAL